VFIAPNVCGTIAAAPSRHPVARKRWGRAAKNRRDLNAKCNKKDKFLIFSNLEVAPGTYKGF